VRNQQLDVAWRRGEHVFDLRVGLQDMPFQNYPNQRMDLTDNRQLRYNASWHGSVGRLVFDARLWHESVEHAMDFGDDKRFWYGMASMPPGVMGVGRACAPVSPTCAAGMPMLTDSHTNGGRLAVDLPLDGADVVRLGAEFIAFRLDDYWPPSGGNMWPGTFVNVNDGQRDRAGLFAEWESTVGEWTRLVGVRVERVDTDAGPVRGYDIDPAPPGSFMMTAADAAAFNARDRGRSDTNWDFAALARRTMGEHATLEFGVSRRTRTPNLYERYAWSTWSMAALMNNTVGDGNGYVGDPDLEPEVAHTVSATLDARTGADGYSLRVSPFYTRISDYIDAVGVAAVVPRAFNVLRYANQDARLAGVDLTAATPTADTAYGRFTLSATASALDGENRDTGAGLYHIIPLQGRIVLEHRAGDWSNSIEVVGVARKDDLSRVRNEIGTPGYGLLDLRFGWKRGDLAVDFGVENVFDRLYRLPQGGAYVGQGTTMMITGVPWGIAVPGRGRAWFAGLRVAF
jgi:iron complex outermembrane receptor protein